jgi:hypothetical protein
VRTEGEGGAWLNMPPSTVSVALDAQAGSAELGAAWANLRSNADAPVSIVLMPLEGVYLAPAAAFCRQKPEDSPWRLQPFRDRASARMAYVARLSPKDAPFHLETSCELPAGRYEVWLHRLAAGNGIRLAARWRIRCGHEVYEVPGNAASGAGWTTSVLGTMKLAADARLPIALEAFPERGQPEAIGAFAFLAFAPSEGCAFDPLTQTRTPPGSKPPTEAQRIVIAPGGAYGTGYLSRSQCPWIHVLAATGADADILSIFAAKNAK